MPKLKDFKKNTIYKHQDGTLFRLDNTGVYQYKTEYNDQWENMYLYEDLVDYDFINITKEKLNYDIVAGSYNESIKLDTQMIVDEILKNQKILENRIESINQKLNKLKEE